MAVLPHHNDPFVTLCPSLSLGSKQYHHCFSSPSSALSYKRSFLRGVALVVTLSSAQCIDLLFLYTEQWGNDIFQTMGAVNKACLLCVCMFWGHSWWQLRSSSWFCTQNSLLAGSGNRNGCWVLNLGKQIQGICPPHCVITLVTIICLFVCLFGENAPGGAQDLFLDLLLGITPGGSGEAMECQGLNRIRQVQSKCPLHCTVTLAPLDCLRWSLLNFSSWLYWNPLTTFHSSITYLI